MGLAKRIIPCLDVDAGRVVKGVRFVDIRDAGDPVEVARRYDEEGADEITFLDITASSDQRDTMVHVVEQVAGEVFIPLTVGGGIRTVEDIRRMLNAGADKVAINTAELFNPEFVKVVSSFTNQCPFFVLLSMELQHFDIGSSLLKIQVQDKHRSPERYGKWMREDEFPARRDTEKRKQDGSDVTTYLQATATLRRTRWK